MDYCSTAFSRRFATTSVFAAMLAPLGSVGTARADDAATTTATTQSTAPADVIGRHPAAAALARLFPETPAAVPQGFVSTGAEREDYLKLIAGSVDYFKKFQNEQGAIIDEFENAEKQYSTPCFAHAAAILVDKAGRSDLIEAATRALTVSINALATKTTADKHADFYIPSIVHALRHLKPHVPAETYAGWAATMKQMVPEKTYVDTQGGGNWNNVNICGETMRAKDGLVADELKAAHERYIEKCLTKQQDHALTKFGLYWDGPIVPMAYDAFARLWWEEMIADGAYKGPSLAKLDDFLTTGGLSTLLLQSPNGEWASGGRSAHHQWNECEIAVICEINANRWKARGRDDLAGAFKRAAHLAVGSVQRWQRPSGELFIVKNRAEPRTRLGYEGYSFKTNYGTLPMAMLAIAYERADDSIAERPVPAEVGGYVFDVRDVFYKISAVAGGYYVLIDTASDAHYNATGLQRVHRVGVSISPLNDSTAAHRWYTPKETATGPALTPSIAWKLDDTWTALPDFLRFKPGLDSKGKVLPAPQQFVERVDLDVKSASPDRTSFIVRYDLKGRGAAPVTELYSLTSEGVVVTSSVDAPAGTEKRVQFPLLVSDGASDTNVQLAGNRFDVAVTGGSLRYELTSAPDAQFSLTGPRVPTHNGFVQAAVAPLPPDATEAVWRITLTPEN